MYALMGVIARTLGRFRNLFRSKLSRAQREEARGRLEEASALYLEAGERDQALRVKLLLLDAATDAKERLQLIGQAIGLSEDPRSLRLRRALLRVDLVRSSELRLGPSELAELGRELEELAEQGRAAEMYALAGDAEGEARALVAAGAVDKLEQVLEDGQRRERDERRRSELWRRVRDLELAGRRREALALARGGGSAGEHAAVALEIEARRVLGPRARIEVDGEALDLAFGDDVIIGRADAAVNLSAPGVSREHLVVRRTARGPEVADLGSRNGTLLSGARVDVPLAIGSGLELMLGGEARIALLPWGKLGARLELGTRVVHLPLGPLQVGPWSIRPAEDTWLELRAERGQPPCLGELRADACVQLCVGDEFREGPRAAVRVRVLA